MSKSGITGGFAGRLFTTSLVMMIMVMTGFAESVQADAISNERLEKQKRYLEMRERERAEKEQAKQQKKANKANAKRNCDNAKGRVNNYKGARALYNYDKKGKKVYLSKSERAKAMKEAEADVKKWCR